jgi:hypothetical protein
VLIIDGLFLQSAPVRHKEILLLLERGVTVAGSSSMGALRAAELWPFGMRGIGEVFTLYRDGAITGDDEVAVIHTSAEDGYVALSEPLVSMRVAIGECAEAGAVSDEVAGELLRIARSLPFRSRSLRMVEQVAAAELPADVVAAFAGWRRAHARDLKAGDARLMLSMAAAGDPALRPHGEADWAITSTGSMHLRAWQQQFHGETVDAQFVSDADASAAIMLFHPEYPATHREDVLRRITGHRGRLPEVRAAALQQARSRGLSVASLPADGWLSDPELRELTEDEALTRLLVRAFGSNGERVTDDAAGSLGDRPDVHAWARRVGSAAGRANQFVPLKAGPGAPATRLRFRDDVIDRTLAAHWGCELEDLITVARDRGIGTWEALHRLAEPFVAYLKIGDRSDLQDVA